MEVVAVCSACLARRDDVDRRSIEESCAGRAPRAIEAAEDFVFPGLALLGRANTICSACARAAVVIAVAPDVALSIDRYRASRRDGPDR